MLETPRSRRPETRWALSAAATQAAGLREMFGGMARILHAGRAAQNGLSAALFAREGLVSSDAGIEAEAGFAKVLSRRHDWDEMTDGLGERWETLENTYKPFATGIVAHPAIDGCIRLRRAHGLAPEEIARIEVAVNPIALMLTDNPVPTTALEARLSIQHVCATGIVHGAAGVAELTDETISQPYTVALRGRIEAWPDDGLERDQARVQIESHDGRVFETFVEHAYGSLEKPDDRRRSRRQGAYAVRPGSGDGPERPAHRTLPRRYGTPFRRRHRGSRGGRRAGLTAGAGLVTRRSSAQPCRRPSGPPAALSHP